MTADEVYGSDPMLRAGLEQHRIGYVLATARSMRISIGPARIRVDDLAAGLPEYCWQTRSAGAGAKGPRWYQWAYLHLVAVATSPPAHRPTMPLPATTSSAAMTNLERQLEY
ncbi:hypothetical protein OG361_34135 [Streptomyces sp. NBC_00090]|uniref:hypothetical protein n=1 Tax=Streptomyces sp. NBC_00090 TaxID=2903619 RepID=UPI003255CD96